MFRLIATVKRGTAADLDEAGVTYTTLEDARKAARVLGHREIVSKVMIVDDREPPEFVEWAAY